MSTDLRYDQIIFKASHNSYEKHETISEQLTFNENEPYNGGCLALEFDIWRHSEKDFDPSTSIDEKYFTVNHSSPNPIFHKKKTLSNWLTEVSNWHDSNTEHYPILITLDIKSSHGDYDSFHDKIDTYLKCHFKEDLIFKPSYFLKDSDLSLCAQVQEKEWPTILSEDLKGKFIFCLSGNKDWKDEYAKQDLKNRYCFSDKDLSNNEQEVSPPTDGNIVFFNFNISKVDLNNIPAFGKQKLITRAYVANSQQKWDNCLGAQVSAIATDKINDHKWAHVCNTETFLEKNYTLDRRSLKNKSNNKYRNDHATKMQDTFESPDCTFIFESQGENIYAIRNAKNNKYFDDTITSMSETVKDDGQKWKLINFNHANKQGYLQNCKNKKYMTKKASKLSDSYGEDEIYIIENI